MSDGYVGIKAEIDEAMSFFKNLDVNKFTIQKKLLGAVGSGARTAARRAYGNVLKKRSGKLYKSLQHRVLKTGKAVVITSNADSGKMTSKRHTLARYGFMLAAGYTITKRFGKDLKRPIVVTPKDFMEPPVERYIDSSECKERLDAELQKQILYWEKRITGASK